MKPAEISFLYRDIQNEMPIHTFNSAKIPSSFSQGLPKNAMELSHKVQNKFLNNHLAEIEEAHHCKILNPKFLNWFLRQNKEYHFNADIGNHDNFLKKSRQYSAPSMNIGDVAFLASLNVVPLGALLQTTIIGSEINGTVGSAQLLISKMSPLATVGAKFNQIAAKRSSTAASGNYKQGIYDDADVDEPTNLLGETSSIAIKGTSDYSFVNLTSDAFADTAQLWAALGATQFTALWRRDNDGTSGPLWVDIGISYPTFPDPSTSVITTGAFVQKMQGV